MGKCCEEEAVLCGMSWNRSDDICLLRAKDTDRKIERFGLHSTMRGRRAGGIKETDSGKKEGRISNDL